MPTGSSVVDPAVNPPPTILSRLGAPVVIKRVSPPGSLDGSASSDSVRGKTSMPLSVMRKA